MTTIEPVVCVQCGHDEKTLYKQYSADVIEITRCSKCGEITDKYIEYDNTIIFIDLLLHRIEAFRHLFFNVGQFRRRWPLRLFLLCLLSESFHKWTNDHQKQQAITAAVEMSFYIKLLQSFVGVAVFMLTASCFSLYLKPPNISTVAYLRRVMDGLMLSNYSLLFLLAVHIWVEEYTEECYWLIKLFRLTTSIRTIQVLSSAGYIPILLILLTSSAAELTAFFYMEKFGIGQREWIRDTN